MDKKLLWRSPWGYRESLIIVAALTVGGWLMQLIAGPFNFYLLHRPVNYAVGGLIILLAFAAVPLRNRPLVKWLSGGPLAVSLLAALLVLSLIMGLTPQMQKQPPHGDFFVRLGFTQVTDSWAFVLVYGLTLLSLAMVIARRLFRPGRRVLFFLNHAGLWLVLAAGGFGAADRERHVMHVTEGQVEWRVYAEDKQVLELPLAIRLDDFDMTEYPARLAVIDRTSGRPLPESNPHFFQIDMEQPEGRLAGWEVTLQEYLPQAVTAGAEGYQASPMPAATQAVRVIARETSGSGAGGGAIRQGWVSGGNRFLPVSPLMLDDHHVLVMTQPEPRSFTSKVKVFTQAGQEREAVIEVNKPLSIGGWMIYQFGYDNQSGRMSNYSSFELVYDPWLYPALAGMLMWALGSLGLIYRGRGAGGEK
ncbi:MAG: cytochrome c biogenesis protein ResB [Candidatus Adiutrix sp.]|jgi:hypothetical protein|nr:cytochrome c biogenesis protein ResB [Candidatus Adiutrix sp.]